MLATYTSCEWNLHCNIISQLIKAEEDCRGSLKYKDHNFHRKSKFIDTEKAYQGCDCWYQLAQCPLLQEHDPFLSHRAPMD